MSRGYNNRKKGRRRVVQAGVVVLGAGTIGTTALLLGSAKDPTFTQAELILDATRSFLEDEPWETINAPPTFGRLDTDETPS